MIERTARRSLVVALWLVPALAAGQARDSVDKSFNLEAIANLVSRGVSTEQIGRLAGRYCISFTPDTGAANRLRQAGADTALVPMLERVCYSGSGLDVETDPAGATVLVDGELLGSTPLRSHVAATKDAFVEVRHGDWAWSGRVTLPSRGMVRMRFDEPEDTLADPSVQTATEIADSLGLLATWHPVDRPVPPAPPTRWQRARSWFVGGAVAALAGYTVGRAACGTHHRGTVVDSVNFPGYDIPASQRCLSGWSFSAALAGAYVADRYAQYRFQQRVARFPKVLEQWTGAQADTREAWFLAQPDISVIRERQLARLRQVQANNQRIVARNVGHGVPEIVVLPVE